VQSGLYKGGESPGQSQRIKLYDPSEIVDNDYETQYLVQRIVTTLGWAFDAAVNGSGAWQVIQQVLPDLVISGIEIPGMSGLDLTLTIKSDPHLGHIPVVLVVLMSFPMLERMAFAAGCDAFIAKPFNSQTLLELLPQLIPQEPSQ
jgi:two-component system, cell cycle response regulator DivK